MTQRLRILGTRGIPAQHGGFETFAQDLSLYLTAQKGWRVMVYCQSPDKKRVETEMWNGVELRHIPQRGDGALATILFDLTCVWDAMRSKDLLLTLGYNTAIFHLLFVLRRRKNIINMDGIEWKRPKWKWYERAFLYLNEYCGAKWGTHLVADHPEIKRHLSRKRRAEDITVIPYSANAVIEADVALIAPYHLKSKQYAIVIARPEPENHILDIVQAFSAKPRSMQLVVLGKLHPKNAYHQAIKEAACVNVQLVGAIYEKKTVEALRFHAALYVHGHSVGGTNPSLVEALGAGNAVLAHDNPYNRWVAGEGAQYFADKAALGTAFDALLENAETRAVMAQASQMRFAESFTHEHILSAYADMLAGYVPVVEESGDMET